MKADKFNYTATETIHYHCPCCAAEWQSNKLPYCPNCEVKIEYASQSPEPNMTSLELFEHRYNKGQKFSWLEMLDFAEAYASQSPEPNTVTEPYHKEAIELVKKFIPNDALAKEYVLESLQQTQAVVSKDDLRIVLALHGMTGTLAQECIKAINELLNQKK